MSVHVQLLANKLTDWHHMMQKTHMAGEEAGLSQRQVDGLMFAIQARKMTRRDYIEVTNASPGTASRDLADLVTKGFLSADGTTRSRVYQPLLPDASSQNQDDSAQLPLPEQGDPD